MLIPTFSPQGDGNETGRLGEDPRLIGLIPTFSPQGDGNKPYGGIFSSPPFSLIPTFSPQGDGNGPTISGSTPPSTINVDPYLFPARGRKH